MNMASISERPAKTGNELLSDAGEYVITQAKSYKKTNK